MADSIRAYHFLRADMCAGEGSEPPWIIGEIRTLPKRRKIIPCQYGYHASPTLWNALTYAPGPVACLVELSGDVTEHGTPVDKFAARSRKLIAAVNVESELRLFAADCAEHVLWIYERDYPEDRRPRQAIEATRAYARGEISDAAWDAAWAAAWAAARDAAEATARDAAWDAAWAAAWAAARDAAGAAARAAARAAAGDAAGAAARAAARDAARDAAWAAARAAARDAARAAAGAAAGAAARDAARTAARDAAWAAARAAETGWQREQFDQRFAGLFAEVAA